MHLRKFKIIIVPGLNHGYPFEEMELTLNSYE